MKRRHLRDDAIQFCDEVRRLRPDTVFGADLIAGFPTETEEMFSRSLAIVDECDLTHLHVFPFSPRNGTPAARMPQLDRGLIKERAARLRGKGDQARQSRYSREVGTTRSVLVEKPGLGRTEHFAAVNIRGGTAGEILSMRITAATANTLLAEPV